MRDSRKFCFPKTVRVPQNGDVLITLKNGTQAYINFQDLDKVKFLIKDYVIFEDEESSGSEFEDVFNDIESESGSESGSELEESSDSGSTKPIGKEVPGKV